MGAVGGKGGEGRAVPYFMLRIRIPNGFLTATQLRTVAEQLDLSPRTVLRWVERGDLPAVRLPVMAPVASFTADGAYDQEGVAAGERIDAVCRAAFSSRHLAHGRLR